MITKFYVRGTPVEKYFISNLHSLSFSSVPARALTFEIVSHKNKGNSNNAQLSLFSLSLSNHSTPQMDVSRLLGVPASQNRSHKKKRKSEWPLAILYMAEAHPVAFSRPTRFVCVCVSWCVEQGVINPRHHIRDMNTHSLLHYYYCGIRHRYRTPLHQTEAHEIIFLFPSWSRTRATNHFAMFNKRFLLQLIAHNL